MLECKCWFMRTAEGKIHARLLVLMLLLTLPIAGLAQFTYTTNNGTITITDYTGLGGEVTIPDTIDGLPVCSIAEGAFANSDSLTSVMIGNGVTNIGYAAFAYCSGLADIIVSSGNECFCTADGILFDENQTTLIQFPGGKTGSDMIPSSVICIGDWAFAGCVGLVQFTIPGHIANIGDAAFESCPNLTSVTISSGVTNIGGDAFWACSSLTNVTIAAGVASIGDEAFFACSSLTNLAIPGSVTSIGNSAFLHCSSLESITHWVMVSATSRAMPLLIAMA